MKMANKRLELHDILCSLLGRKDRVYYQPPSNIHLTYPCILYALDTVETKFGNNAHYYNSCKYTVTYVTKEPDDLCYEKLAMSPWLTMNQKYISDNLYHYVFKTNL